MSRPFEIGTSIDTGRLRKALFALEVLDGVTMQRISSGIKVTAEGLKGEPFVNAGGLFVWLQEDASSLTKVTVDPRMRPFEKADIAAADISLGATKPTQVQLSPLCAYPFAPGVTAIRGRLVEQRTAAPSPPDPVAGAQVRLAWLDDDNVTWRIAPTDSHTDASGGFAVVLRLAPSQIPRLDTDGRFTVRLLALRDGQAEQRSPDTPLAPGRLADDLTFAWNEFQP